MTSTGYLSKVNQKLLYARVLVERIRAGEESGHRRDMLVEALVFQLYLLHRFHLQEIAAAYECPGCEQVVDGASLSLVLNEIGKEPAEAGEILALLEQGDSWLSLLIGAFNACFRIQAPGKGTRGHDTLAITATDITENLSAPALEDETIIGWFDALEELVERHRELMVEF